jgi:hypothetical protein
VKECVEDVVQSVSKKLIINKVGIVCDSEVLSLVKVS